MRKPFFSTCGLALLVTAALSCSKTIDDGGSGDVDFTNAKRVVSSVFYAARSGDSDHLASLCDPAGTANQHVMRICGQLKGGPDWAEFVEQFQKGKLIGEARISGESAQVNFVFGRSGTDPETMELVRRDGQWHLVAF